MPQYDQNNAECLVYTFKDGLLSKIAHDLELRVTRFTLTADAERPFFEADLDASSLRVETAMQDGRENPSALSDSDKEKIAAQIRAEVLESGAHPRIRFSTTRAVRRPDGGYDLSGSIRLHGVTREVNVATRIEGQRHVAELDLHQPDYGITVFKAMMGTLKIKPGVKIKISIPAA